MKPRLVCLWLVIAVALVVRVETATACSCTDYPTFEQARERSDAIFRGTVVRVDVLPERPYMVMATLVVTAWWKGEVADSAHVVTGENSGVCGVEFELGHEYLVYAFDDTNPELVYTHSCWRTHELWPDDPDLIDLGQPSTAVEHAHWGTLKQRYVGARKPSR